MLSDYQSFVDYVSLVKCSDDDIQFDTIRIAEIRDRFEQLHNGKSKIDDYLRKETVKNLMDELKIIDDQTNFEYVDLVVQQDSDDSINLELKAKFIPPTDISEPITTFVNVTKTSITTPLLITTSITTTAPEKAQKKPKSQQLIESKSEIVENIICIIHKKSPPRVEIDDFFRDFLFLEIQPPK